MIKIPWLANLVWGEVWSEESYYNPDDADCVMYYDGPLAFFYKRDGVTYYLHNIEEVNTPDSRTPSGILRIRFFSATRIDCTDRERILEEVVINRAGFTFTRSVVLRATLVFRDDTMQVAPIDSTTIPREYLPQD